MKENVTGIVRFELDPKNPKMRARQIQELKALKDRQIDYSDIPYASRGCVDAPWGFSSGGNKKQLTVRLDADVLEFVKKTGVRYQNRINAALREYMEAHEKAS